MIQNQRKYTRSNNAFYQADRSQLSSEPTYPLQLCTVYKHHNQKSHQLVLRSLASGLLVGVNRQQRGSAPPKVLHTFYLIKGAITQDGG
jgi:hypothetical protein